MQIDAVVIAHRNVVPDILPIAAVDSASQAPAVQPDAVAQADSA